MEGPEGAIVPSEARSGDLIAIIAESVELFLVRHLLSILTWCQVMSNNLAAWLL